MLSGTFLTFDLTRVNVSSNVWIVGVFHLRSIMASMVVVVMGGWGWGGMLMSHKTPLLVFR